MCSELIVVMNGINTRKAFLSSKNEIKRLADKLEETTLEGKHKDVVVTVSIKPKTGFIYRIFNDFFNV